MLSSKMQEMLNRQINEEMFSEYLYLSMAAWFDDEGLEGFSNFFKKQAQEEREHAMKFYNYIYEADGKVKLLSIKEPENEFESPEQIFEAALKHEKYITSRINDLVTLAKEEKDYATEVFLSWYVTEQVEEEATMKKYCGILKRVSGSGQLLMIDEKLGKR